jgi:hypothetical protein
MALIHLTSYPCDMYMSTDPEQRAQRVVSRIKNVSENNLTPDQYPMIENRSEEKILKIREPAAELARKLLD